MRRSSRRRGRQSRDVGRARGRRVAGELLRALRLAREWTQSRAAEQAGISDRLVRKAESGGPIDRQSIELLAELYSTPDKRLTSQDLLAEPLEERAHESVAHCHERLMRRWFEEVWKQGRLDKLDELTSPDCVFHVGGLDLRGPAAVGQRVDALRAGFRDFDIHVEHVIVHRDVVASCWRMGMTSKGVDRAPTSKRIVMRGSTWMHIQNGRLAECWDFWEHPQIAGRVPWGQREEAPVRPGRSPRKRR